MGNGRRVNEPSMHGKWRQDALRQTGKYNTLVGALLSTSSPLGQKREREKERRRCYYSVCFPLLNGVEIWSYLCNMKHTLSGLGNLSLLKMPRCPFSISSTILELNSLLTVIVSLSLVRNLSSLVDRWKEKHFFFLNQEKT